MTAGSVAIVGAGPGDPELVTVRAHRRLVAADLVLRDGLVPRAVADIAINARHCVVSRRPGAARIAPADVVALMVDAVDRGQRVVRLRAGDPFVLARGAEEILGLVAAEVPIEIVPGLTTASAAATLAGIPLTHRGIASGFVVVSGHAADAYAPGPSALPPQSTTVVVLMGLAERSAIAALLRSHGWSASTPAAVITAASQPGQQTWRGTLAALGDRRAAPGTAVPGVIVIGGVVGVGAEIARAIQATGNRSGPTGRSRERAAVQTLEEAAWQQ